MCEKLSDPNEEEAPSIYMQMLRMNRRDYWYSEPTLDCWRALTICP